MVSPLAAGVDEGWIAKFIKEGRMADELLALAGSLWPNPDCPDYCKVDQGT